MKDNFLNALFIFFVSISFGQTKEISPNDIYAEAQELIKNEQWEEAEKKMTTLIKLYPTNADLYFKRGYVLEMNFKYLESISDFTQAIILKPSMHTVRTNRGFAYRNLGEYEKAIADFTTELAINPNPYSYEHRSQIYYLIKNYKKALEDVNISIEKDPKNSISFKTRALIYKAIDLKEKACEDKEKAIELKILTKYPKYAMDISEINEYCNN